MVDSNSVMFTDSSSNSTLASFDILSGNNCSIGFCIRNLSSLLTSVSLLNVATMENAFGVNCSTAY